MPVNFEIDVVRGLVVTVVTGAVTAADMRAYQAALAKDPRFSPAFDSLTDFLGAEPFTGTAGEIKQLSQDSPFAPGAKRALVASTDLHFGLSRMAQMYAEMRGLQVRVFRDRAAAFAWLKRDVPPC